MANGDADPTKLHDAFLIYIRDKKARLEKQAIDIRAQLLELGALEAAFETASGYARDVIEAVKYEADEQPLSSEDTNKSQREILHLIGERNDGWLVVDKAIKSMVTARILTEDTASAQVYTILKQNDKEFMRIFPGLYFVPPSSTMKHTKAQVQPRSRHGRRDRGTGLADRVNALLNEHPDWQAADLRNQLLRENWDFAGKSPVSAVNMAYANTLKRRKRLASAQLPLRQPSTLALATPLAS